jgi:hypothetical protein
MSAVHSAPAPATAGAGRTRALARRFGIGASLAAVAAAGAVAFWPASETDKARDDGERFGAAVAQLQSADTAGEVDAALVDLRGAAVDTRDHAGDAVGDQVSAQADALDRAVDGFVGERTTDSSFEADLYHAELDTAVDDVASQAGDFRASGPEVQQAFWEGYEEGFNGD